LAARRPRGGATIPSCCRPKGRWERLAARRRIVSALGDRGDRRAAGGGEAPGGLLGSQRPDPIGGKIFTTVQSIPLLVLIGAPELERFRD